MRTLQKTITPALVAASFLLAAPHAGAQESEGGGFGKAASAAERDLKEAMAELSALRERIAAEKVPLNRELREAEQRLVEVRRQFEDVSRTLDTRNLDLNNLRQQMEALRAEKTYASNLLDEYVRNLETRIHIVERQRFLDDIEAARNAPGNSNLTPAKVYETQLGLVESSIERLLDITGGARFEGQAVAPDGELKPVDYALVGPVAFYAAKDGSSAGLAEEKLNSAEPNMVVLDDPAMVEGARQVATTGSGPMPFDPTLGNAQVVEQTEDTFAEHVAKGGPVMVPILAMATAALIVALIKWGQLARVPMPGKRKVEGILELVRRGDMKGARAKADAITGPTGEMLREGVDHAHEPKELVEEVMFERVLDTRLSLQSYLPFIAICAAAAPLLGLLGTVTGIINTFKMITVFGTGDAKTLSGGISEALITTKFGLIVAIPSLLLHAYLARKAKRIVDGMEKVAISFVNRLALTSPPVEEEPIEKAG